MKIRLDPKALTLGDLEDFETATGEGLMETFEKIDKAGTFTSLRARSVSALIWVCARQDNPDFTLDDARKVRVDELEIEEVDEADPTSGGD